MPPRPNRIWMSPPSATESQAPSIKVDSGDGEHGRRVLARGAERLENQGREEPSTDHHTGKRSVERRVETSVERNSDRRGEVLTVMCWSPKPSRCATMSFQ
ncbi:unnamed protein product [Gadus morhua 'NCC']